MDFIENAASKYMQGSSGKSQGGGLDWNNLSTMAQQFNKADQHTGGNVDPSTFKNFLGGFGGGSQSGSQAQGGAMGEIAQGAGQPPAGYPTASGSAPNTDVIHQLLGKYTEHTGEQFQGNDSQYSKLEEIAAKMTGTKIPLPILKKMVSWKLNGLM